MSKIFHFPIEVFLDDTDYSGLVHHSNFLRFFERARSSLIGTMKLTMIWEESGLVPAVYKAEVTYASGAKCGDKLDIRTSFVFDGDFRIIFNHEAYKENDILVAKGIVHNVAFNSNHKLVKIPDEIKNIWVNL